jgi:hypothetical protein
LLPAIHYRRCFFTGDKLTADVIEIENPEQGFIINIKDTGDNL